jgi:diguanylate cyclase
MLGRVLDSRALARSAVAGLAVGLLVLIGLALWGTSLTERSTAQLRAMNNISDGWGQVSQHMVIVDEALHDFQHAGSDIGREPLVSALTAAQASLVWVAKHDAPERASTISSVQRTFDSYRRIIQNIYATGGRGDPAAIAVQVEQASLGLAAMRKQVEANVARNRLEIADYLDVVDQGTQRLRTAATLVLTAELVLLVVCATVLLRYQHRVERQAEGSRRQALHDSLTGLGNRSLLADRMDAALRRQQGQQGEQVGLLLVDLDRFKEVNDTLGHHHGDLLLQEVAARLQESVRGMDTVVRLGGDEFAVLLACTASAADAADVAQRLLAQLRQPAELDGVVVDVGASIGVTVYPDISSDAGELLQHADIAMYAAKRGQLGVVIYDAGINEHSRRQLTLLGELRRAVELENQLVVYYQPKASIDDRSVIGVEALVRWEHPEHGLLGPDQFIPLAEESGLIDPLTDLVLGAALGHCQAWLQAGLRIPVAVNIASRCLLDPNFPTRVALLLAKHGIPGDMLTLEVTESALITDPDRATDVLGRLRALRMRLSLDDFGTGYASMSYLRTLPLHELKIDRSFIKTMLTSREDGAIVRAVLTLAHSLDLQVVAEGVEDEATWRELANLGCDIVQGYYLSRPMPAAHLASWVAARRPAGSAQLTEPDHHSGQSALAAAAEVTASAHRSG